MYLSAQNQFGQQLQYQNNRVQQQEGEIRQQMQQVDQDESSIQKELSQINHEDNTQYQQSYAGQTQQQYGGQYANTGSAQYAQKAYSPPTQTGYTPNGATVAGAAPPAQQGLPMPIIFFGFVGAAAVCYINGGWRAAKILDYSSEDRFNPRL